MTTVGLYNKDARIYYVDPDYAVLDDPTENGTPTLIKRKGGPLDNEAVSKILTIVGMSVREQPRRREDGLWCIRLTPLSEGGEHVNGTHNDWRGKA